MKTLLPLLAIVLMMPACSSMDYGYYEQQSGYVAQTMPIRQYQHYQRPQPYVMGPQYYRVHSNMDLGCNPHRIKNHMNAPLVVDYRNSGGRRESVVIPASWD
jgi:hypothetical protein